MFEYFKLGQFKVEPCQINTVDEAIDDYEIRKREFQTWKYSAASLGTKLDICKTCLLHHPPIVKTDNELFLERREKKRADKL